MKKLLSSIGKKIAYLFAACIIIVAIFVCVSRMLTPTLDKHRADFEKWASQLLAMPVTIGQVQVAWYQYQPVISLNAVTVLNNETKEPVLQIQKVRVFFSLPKSLWQRRPVPSGLLISGAELSLHQAANGETTIQGFPALGGYQSEPYKKETKFTDMIGWLSLQPRLILQNIDIRYQSFTGQKRFITLYRLSLLNTDSTHTILGSAILHQDVPTSVNVSLEWKGKHFDLSQIKANAYLYVSGLSLSQWWKGFVWHGWQINKGIGSAKIWASWDKGAFQKIQSEFQLYHLKFLSQKDLTPHTVSRLSGHIGWKRDGADQVIAGEDVLIDLPHHLWPVTNFYIDLKPDANNTLIPKQASIGYVDLHDIQEFLFVDAPIPDTIRQPLEAMKITGNLHNTSIVFPENLMDYQHYTFNTYFDDLTFAPWQKLPGVTHLSGEIKGNGLNGQLILNNNHFMAVDYDTLFEHPIFLHQLKGTINWQNAKTGWIFQADALQVSNPDVAIKTSGSLTLPSKAAATMDMNADFTIAHANKIAQYLPARIFDKSLTDWLRDAFHGGKVTSGKAILRGALNAFPFDHHEGQFSISGQLNDVDLHYADLWPSLQHINGQLAFSGSQMTVDATSANMLDIPLKNIHGFIPQIGGNVTTLTVKSDSINTDFTHALQIIHQSPLKDSLTIFSNMKFSGPLSLNLGLSIPLDDPNKTSVQGNLTANNAEMAMTPWGLTVDHLNGQLQFTESSITAKGLQGQLFKKPLQLDLATIHNTKNASTIEASIQTNLSAMAIENWLNIPITKVVNGTSALNGKIDFSSDKPLNIYLQSNLVGMTVDLPDEFAKSQQTAKSFSAEIVVKDEAPLQVQLVYGNHLSAALILQRNEKGFDLNAANLHLGTGLATYPESKGLFITGNFSELDWEKLKQYSADSSESHFAGPPLRGIDITSHSVKLFGQQFKQVRLKMTPEKDRWLINLTSPDVSGNIEVPLKLSAKGLIKAQFNTLHLQSAADLKDSPTIDVKTLPAIAFTANNLRVNDIPVGSVMFQTTPSDKGLTIEDLRIASPRISLRASGDWTESNVTHLSGIATSGHVSDLLSSLGVNAHNFVANNGRIQFNLNWEGAPFSPVLADLKGNANIDLGPGRVVEVGEANGAKMDIGRMLSIFSLQTIPRRLSLDFSDLVEKGYSFDYVRGDVVFKNGNALTNNLTFEGPVAQVHIAGRIGLKQKDFDFTLSVTPHVTSSLPVAAGLLAWWNPIVGLAAFGVNTVISSGVSKATTYYYDVSGPWANPTWRSVRGSVQK